MKRPTPVEIAILYILILNQFSPIPKPPPEGFGTGLMGGEQEVLQVASQGICEVFRAFQGFAQSRYSSLVTAR